MELPEHPRLAEVAGYLEKARTTSWIIDSDFRLVWVSEEAVWSLGVTDQDDLGIGRHAVEALTNRPWIDSISPEGALSTFLESMPFIMAEPKMADSLRRAAIPEPFADLLAQIEPADHQPPVWTMTYDYVNPAGEIAPATWIFSRLHDTDGSFLGAYSVFTPGLRGRVMLMLSRGDEAMHERMARLAEPARRSAAILFADIQDSVTLSRGLASATYFALVRDLTSAIDAIVGRNEGVVGRHAGDGMSSFFLTEDHGSDSAAARAALETARAVGVESNSVVHSLAKEHTTLDPALVRLNIGLHWGATLYMGQLVTGGRLEVAALGDEVNECARIQECARDGITLATKALLERLDSADSLALGIDPSGLAYMTVGSIEGASAKALRDVGALAVTQI